MMKTTRTASNSKDLKVLNRIKVLNTVRKNGPIARYEVAKLTALTPPAVTVIVNELIKVGVIQETGWGESSGGRRPVMLELNPRFGYIFAVRLQHGIVNTALLDLAGTILESRHQKLDTTHPDEVVSIIVLSLNLILSGNGISREKVFCCGVASPGLVNSYEGIVERSSNLDWGRFPLAAMLSQCLDGLPVHVENISNAAALGEKTYGNGVGCENLVYLNLSVGIGAGIIINNALFGGARGYAGEIGSARVLYPTVVGDENVVKYSTFEQACSVRTILERIKAVVTEQEFAKLGLSKARLTIEEALLSPLIEIPEVREIINEVSLLIGIKVAELIHLFNTDRVILGGELTRVGDLLLNTIIQTVKENSLAEMTETVKITVSTMREDPALMGVYALILEKLFISEEWLQL